MTRSTDMLRDIWAPACQGPFAKIVLYGGGVVVVDPLIVPAVKALDTCLRAHDYQATGPDVGAYNCRPITGGTKFSLHAFGIALDLNWQANPYGTQLKTNMPPAMREAIKAIRTNGGAQVWRWGGDYVGNKDAMHYEVVASPKELTTGIDPATVPGHRPAPDPAPTAEDDTPRPLTLIVSNHSGAGPLMDAWFKTDGTTRSWVPTEGHARQLAKLDRLDHAGPDDDHPVPHKVGPDFIRELIPATPSDNHPGRDVLHHDDT